MKKIISGLVSLVMVLSILVVPMTAQAASEAYNPDVAPYYWTFMEEMDSSNYFAQPTKAEARTGETSLVVYNRTNSWKTAVNTISYQAEKTYAVTIYLKGAHAPSNFQVGFDYNTIAKLSDFEAEQGADGWTKYTAELTPTAAGTRIFLMTYGCLHVYIDDFSVIEKESGTNYIVNGSFDYDYKRPYDDSVKLLNWSDYFGDAASKDSLYYQPTDFDAFDGDRAMAIYNTTSSSKQILQPSKAFTGGTTYSVSLYTKGNFYHGNVQIGIDYQAVKALTNFTKTDAENGWTKWETELTPGANCSRLFINTIYTPGMLIDKLSVIDKTTNQEMVINGSFEDIYYTSAQKKATTPVWTMVDTAEFGENSANYFETSVLDSSDGDGKSLFVSYIPSKANAYIRIQNAQVSPVFLTSVGTYEVSMSLKGEYDPNSVCAYTNAWNAQSCNAAHTVTDLGNGWKRYSMDMSVTANAGYLWLVLRGSVKVYIDDITITQKSGGTLGEALTIANADFSQGIYALASENPKLPANWTFTMPTYDAEGAVYGKNYFGEISSEAKSGNASMKIALPYYESGKYAMLRQNAKINGGEEYKVSFWLKGDFAATNVVFNLGDWNTAKRLSDFTAEETVNGWTKYSGKMTSEQGGGGIWFILYSGSSLFIDDVAVVGENSVNQVINSGFEDNYDIEKTGISNILAYPVKSGTSVVISWTNPDVDVSEYEVIYNGEGTMDFTPNYVANGYNECVLKDLTANGKYSITVLTTTKYGIEQQTINFTARENTSNLLDRDYLGVWTFANSDGAAKYANAEAAVDYNNYSEGKASLRITSFMQSYEANCFAALSQNVTLNTQKDYKLTFDAKLDEAKRPKLVRTATLSDSTAITKEVPLSISEHKTDGWVTFEGVISDYDWDSYEYLYSDENYGAKLELIFTDMCGTMYVDNFSLVEVDDYGDVVGLNIFGDSGFEFDEYHVEDALFTQIEGGESFDIEEPAKGTVTVSRRMEAYMKDLDVIFYVGLYKNNQLLNAQNITSTVKKGTGYETFSLDVNIDEEDVTGYSIKTFLWDSDMTPWASANEI